MLHKHPQTLVSFFKDHVLFIYLFILAVPGLSCGMRDLQHAGYSLWHAGFLVAACGVLVAACRRDLVPQPGIKPRPPALGTWSLTFWTTREVPVGRFLTSNSLVLMGL